MKKYNMVMNIMLLRGNTWTPIAFFRYWALILPTFRGLGSDSCLKAPSFDHVQPGQGFDAIAFELPRTRPRDSLSDAIIRKSLLLSWVLPRLL